MRLLRFVETFWSRACKFLKAGHELSLSAMALAACLGLASGALAQEPLTGSFSNIDPPGTATASAFGINNDGVIVGRYKTTLAGFYHGFLRDETGSYSAVAPPDAIWTEAHGINNNGVVVGYFCDTAPCGAVSTYRGFLLNDGVYSSFGAPNHVNTWAVRINDLGQIVGCDHNTDTMGTMHGFVDNRGTFTDLGLPASMNNGISPDGKTIAGFYTDMITFATHGYILKSGKVTPFDVPGAMVTQAWDLNGKGQIVGAYVDSGGHLHGFLRTPAGAYFSINYPGATSTWAFGLNDNGQIVGQYLDASGVRHAFSLTTDD